MFSLKKPDAHSVAERTATSRMYYLLSCLPTGASRYLQALARIIEIEYCSFDYPKRQKVNIPAIQLVYSGPAIFLELEPAAPARRISAEALGPRKRGQEPVSRLRPGSRQGRGKCN